MCLGWGSGELLLPHLVPMPFSGTGEGMKPPKPGEVYPVPVSLGSPLTPHSLASLTPFCCLPGFSNGNGMGAGAFPGVGAQPGEGTRELGGVRARVLRFQVLTCSPLVSLALDANTPRRQVRVTSANDSVFSQA